MQNNRSSIMMGRTSANKSKFGIFIRFVKRRQVFLQLVSVVVMFGWGAMLVTVGKPCLKTSERSLPTMQGAPPLPDDLTWTTVSDTRAYLQEQARVAARQAAAEAFGVAKVTESLTKRRSPTAVGDVPEGVLDTNDHISTHLNANDDPVQHAIGDIDTKEKLIELARSLNRAMKTVRGTKTRKHLQKSWTTLSEIMTKMKIDVSAVTSRPEHELKSVCPEKYMGTTYGYPLFYKGFEMTNCTYAKPLHKLVTVLAYIKANTSSTLEESVKTFVSSVNEMKLSLQMVLAIQLTDSQPKPELSNCSNCKIIYVLDAPDGKVWNSLVSQTKTPYSLVTHRVEQITQDARLERLIREIERLGVAVAGGAFREPNGHWRMGCYQTVMKNYTLKYTEGYDESIHECVVCDYIEGPFVVSTQFVKYHAFNSGLSGQELFQDWFLTLGHLGNEAIVCPDSMFHVYHRADQKSYNLLMSKWNLYRLVSPYGNSFVSNCGKYPDSGKRKTKALSPCSLQTNAGAVKKFMALCEKYKIMCELEEGTALGAVKFGKTLPWERDADISILSDHAQRFHDMHAEIFRNTQIQYVLKKAPFCCKDNRTAGGVFALKYGGWSIEIYGMHILDSDTLQRQNIKPTRVLLDGQWVNVARNPGLFVRNRYGHEIYRHAQHWMSTSQRSGWINYDTGPFEKCVQPNDHSCLDLYNSDGNIQFTDVFP